MLDPKLCTSPNLVWSSLARQVFDIFVTPKVALISGGIFVGLLTIAYLRFRHFENFYRVLILITVISLLPLILSLVVTSTPFLEFANAQLMNFSPEATLNNLGNSLDKNDAIVILGRGEAMRESRVKVASDLWRSQQAPKIFASGRGDAQEMQDMLKAIAIPVRDLSGEDCSRTTAENAEFTGLLLKPQGINKILLVTDPPHMLRSLLTFRRYGFEVTAAPSLLPATLSDRDRKLLILREFIALITYKILGRLG